MIHRRLEEQSIAKADLFGDYLLEDHSDDIRRSAGSGVGAYLGETFYAPFDPSLWCKDNPFASYLRKLADDLDIPGVVNVDGGDIRFGSPVNFPDYNICSDELNRIANGSPDARRVLKTGHERLSEIPEELMAEDAGEERAEWLEDKLPNIYKHLKEEDANFFADAVATDPSGNLKKSFEEADSKTEKGGDDQ